MTEEISNQIVILTLESFFGLCPGARHYYATLHGKHKVTLQDTISEAEAQRRNTQDRIEGWKAGQPTQRFESEQKAIDEAIHVWQLHFPDAKLLMVGETSILDPQLMLDGPKRLVSQLNRIYEKTEKIGFWDRDEAKMEKLCSQWNNILTGALTCPKKSSASPSTKKTNTNA